MMAEEQRKPFRTVGMRMQRFSNKLMRSYLPPSEELAPSTPIPPVWEAAAQAPILWEPPPAPSPTAPTVASVPQQSIPDSPPMPSVGDPFITQPSADPIQPPVTPIQRAPVQPTPAPAAPVQRAPAQPSQPPAAPTQPPTSPSSVPATPIQRA